MLRLDFKRRIRAHLGLLFLDSLHLGPTGALAQAAGEFRKLVFGTNRVHFHAAVIQIAHVTAQSEFAGDTLRKVAEPNTLDAAADPPTTGGLGG